MVKKKKKFTREQINKAKDYRFKFSETYVEPKGMMDNPIPKKDR